MKNKFPLVLGFRKYKCIGIFVFWILMNWLVFSLFVWFLLAAEMNYYYLVPFTFLFVLEFTTFYLLFQNIFKKMSTFGINKKEKAIEIFEIYQKNLIVDCEVKKFQIIRDHRKSLHNSPFQFNQKRYQKKVKRLKNKEYENEQYTFKLLILYINYLKTYAVFFKRINPEDEHLSFVIAEQKHQDFEILKNCLVNNFFAFTR